jgi:hypothetical protein
MATVNYRNERAEVRFYDHSGVRRTLASERFRKRSAESAAHIEGLLGLQNRRATTRTRRTQRGRAINALELSITLPVLD